MILNRILLLFLTVCFSCSVTEGECDSQMLALYPNVEIVKLDRSSGPKYLSKSIYLLSDRRFVVCSHERTSLATDVYSSKVLSFKD